MKGLIWLGAAILLLIMLPSAFAFNCNSLGKEDLQTCQTINQLNITEEEKDLLASATFYTDKEFPNHDFVYFWNTALNIQEAPYSVKKQDKGYIKDAWLKILAVMPSFLEDNTLFADSKGKIQTEYNYRIELPNATMQGDCRTDYLLESNTSKLDVLINNELIGHDKLNPFDISNSLEDLYFRAELNIEARTRIEHYNWNTYCCNWWYYWWHGHRKSQCIQYCTVCQYSNTEIKTDKLELTDNLNAILYKDEPESIFKITDKFYNITKGFLNASNFSNLILEFQDSKYQNNKYFYDLNYSFKPYYVLTIRANRFRTEKSQNIYIENSNNTEFRFTVKNINNCKIRFFTPFREISKDCDLNYSTIGLYIKTDKLSYKVNETIKVEIFPKDVLVELTYSNETKTAKNQAEFTAKPLTNKITARYGSEKTERIINLTDAETWNILLNFSIFSFMNYLLFRISKKYWRNLI